ncbi:MAG: UDP-N-acetylmuramate dehydrogenase [Candidatus Pacebacteria bacterium]|nr:UDP-N-acetylmuramate dehydrogenase [Candidatus Paceibacterota bacterium]
MKRIKIQKNALLAPLTTFRIGGPAKYLVTVKNPEDLLEAINWSRKKRTEFRVFGGGSNSFFPDQGLDCLVIRFLGGRIKKEKEKLSVDGGVLLAKLIIESVDNSLEGLEKLAGIPGTVGGAIAGNAGAYGQTISDTLQEVEIFDGEKRRWMTKKDCFFGYRDSLFKHQPLVILKAIFKLRPGDKSNLKEAVQAIIAKRHRQYGPNPHCPGCFFKNKKTAEINPKILKKIDQKRIIKGKIPAGYLLEAVGAKGMRVGDIQVANFHANFLVNVRQGKASEVKELAEVLKNKVKERFGVNLEEEALYFQPIPVLTRN